jgi:cobalt-zinc-cadmium efflux system protein
LMAAAIGLSLLPRTWALLKQAIHILMEGTPTHIDIEKVAGAMKEVKGVTAVHDLHIWTITSGVEAMSAHVTIQDSRTGDPLLGELQALLKQKFGIDHVTIQLEALEIKACTEEGMHS